MEKYRKNIVKLILDEWDDLRWDEMLVEFIHEQAVLEISYKFTN